MAKVLGLSHACAMTDPAFCSATELLLRLRQREISSLELLDHFIARVERHDPALNALVVRDFGRARERARQADAARARREDWGPLHGLPMTVKEAFDVPGLPTTWGHPERATHKAEAAAEAVRRLQAAGAIVFGKSNVPVDLADWQSFNPLYGTTCNPWDLSRSPGGSSGGSAALLAAGLTPLELGSDIGASIRNPAHYCGIYGHKPTWGLVPMAGHQLPGMGCIDTLDIAVVGPMARSAEDLQLSMDVLASPLQHFGLHGWSPTCWHDTGAAPGQMRVAIMANDDTAEVDQSVEKALLDLADHLEREGVAVDRQARPVDSQESHATYIALLRAGQAALLGDEAYRKVAETADRFDPADTSYAARHWRAHVPTHQAWARHHQTRLRLQQQWADFFGRFDLLICPVAATPAVAHNHVPPRWEQMLDVNGRPQPQTTQMFWAGYPGVVGLPATAIPLALSPQGLPVGAQIIGPLRADPMTLRFARWLENSYRGFQAPVGYQ